MTAQLEYAKRPSVTRRRWFRRAVVGLFIASVAMSAVWWAPPAWNRARLLYVQRQCMRYAAPDGQLICAEPLPYGGQTPPFTVAATDPNCFSEFVGRGWGAAGTPIRVRAIVQGPVLFLHERRSKSGVRRLVVVRRTPPGGRMSWDIPLSFNVTLIEPAGLSGPPRMDGFDLPDAVPPRFGDGSPNPPLLRLFAGQPDPADESHFTIEYEVDADRGTIDGWLRDSQDASNPVRVELGQR
jgi:hypothetical protein